MLASAKPIDARSRTVLVVDDEPQLRATMGRVLELAGFTVFHAATRSEARALAVAHPPANAVVDLMLAEASGLDVVGDLRALAPEARIVVVTGFGSVPTAVAAVRLGAVDYLAKPVDPDELVAALDPARVRSPTIAGEGFPTLERAQWEYIQRTLRQCSGNVSQAARRLGLHRQSLQRMLKRNPPRR